MYVKRLNMSPNLSTQQHKVRAAEKEKKRSFNLSVKNDSRLKDDKKSSLIRKTFVLEETNKYWYSKSSITTVALIICILVIPGFLGSF